MSQQPGNPFLRQRFFNRASQASWQAFAAHRDQVTSRLEAAAPGSLCVLGAGNCNDIDLVRLSAHFRKITLVDIDAEAMQAGVAFQFQTADEPTRLRRQRIVISPCDLTGALDLCHEITHAPSKETLARLRLALTQLPAIAQGEETFDAVASTCLLSQLIGIFRHAVGESSPELRPLAELVRLQHLRTLAELTAPGGTALLFADFVSSETQPALLHAPAAALPAIMESVVQQHACFIGMNPAILRRLLDSPPLASHWAAPPQSSPPWVWNLGPRSYLVTAITAKRTQPGVGLSPASS